jgi:hypothetical protein
MDQAQGLRVFSGRWLKGIRAAVSPINMELQQKPIGETHQPETRSLCRFIINILAEKLNIVFILPPFDSCQVMVKSY